jgi:hypothetical protein
LAGALGSGQLLSSEIVAKATTQGARKAAMDDKSRLSGLPADGIALASEGLLPFSATNHEHR